MLVLVGVKRGAFCKKFLFSLFPLASMHPQTGISEVVVAAEDRQEKSPGGGPVLVPKPVALSALDGAGSCCPC